MGYCGFRNAYLSADLIPYNNFGKEPSEGSFYFTETFDRNRFGRSVLCQIYYTQTND